MIVFKWLFEHGPKPTKSISQQFINLFSNTISFVTQYININYSYFITIIAEIILYDC